MIISLTCVSTEKKYHLSLWGEPQGVGAISLCKKMVLFHLGSQLIVCSFFMIDTQITKPQRHIIHPVVIFRWPWCTEFGNHLPYNSALDVTFFFIRFGQPQIYQQRPKSSTQIVQWCASQYIKIFRLYIVMLWMKY